MHIGLFICAAFLIQAADSLKDLQEIDCKKTAFACPEEDICKARCKYSCIQGTDHIRIWGTTVYYVHSSICKSALHDLRISAWDESTRDVYLKRIPYENAYQKSVRFGFSSYSNASHNIIFRSFIFLSPRVSENILDVTSTHKNYLFGEGENHIQECFITSLSEEVKFAPYIFSNVQVKESYESSQIPLHGNSTLFRIIWSNLTSETAGYQCIPQNSMLSTVTSLAFEKDAHFYPLKLTITVNINDTVNLIMLEDDYETFKTLDTVWKKDGFLLNDLVSKEVKRTVLSVFQVNIGSAGIYSLDYKNHSVSRPGYVRLIVRACEEGSFGDNCTEECPSCLNGGICHDITGDCICAPGFNGTLCEAACDPGYFGKECNMKCSGKTNESSTGTCRGVSICLPDPYGCSCPAGFTGLFCNETCSPGNYGAGCSEQRECSCANDENCSIFSGHCEHKCAAGWHGVFCNESYPVLNNYPHLLNMTKDSVSILFTGWSRITDIGSGVPQMYQIEYKEAGSDIWSYGPNISIPSEKQKDYEVKVSNLKPGMKYILGVVVVDKSGNRQEKNIKLVNFTTQCEVPHPPDAGYISNETDSSITIKWEAPLVIERNLSSYMVTLIAVNSFNLSYVGYKRHFTIRNINVRTFKFSNLLSTTSFLINIQAGDEAGYSVPLILLASTKRKAPVINMKLILVNQKEREVMVKVPPPNQSERFAGHSFILVEPLQLKMNLVFHNDIKIFHQNNCSETSSHKNAYLTGKIIGFPENSLLFTIGNGSCVNGYYNAPLEIGKSYRIGILFLIYYGKEMIYSRINYMPEVVHVKLEVSEKDSRSLGIILGLLFPFAITVGIVVFLLYMRNAELYDSSGIEGKLCRSQAQNEFAACNEALDEMDMIETESLCEEFTNRIPVKNLMEYVKHNVQNNKIKKEFMSLPRGQIYACSRAKVMENKTKNRYGNILPYDHSRVILDTVGNDINSDYIHGNYIDGFGKGNKYIATQGPLPSTVNDFWRMVWKEGAYKILMTTNLVESGKVKCEKYWPDDTELYGDVTVSLHGAKPYADFVIRTFNISKGQEKRELHHFHFTSWPDHGIPSNATPFIDFLSKARAYNSKLDSPVIVHCSAGIGRTGAIILLDTMIEMGINEGHVDLLGHLCSMRRQRMNILEVFDQYLFVYYALLEVLCLGSTCVPCSDFKQEYEQLKSKDGASDRASLSKQFEMLDVLCPQLLYKDMLDAYLMENQVKNRYAHILPPDRARPFLFRDCCGTGYINAVYVNSYTRKEAFVATQYPLPETLVDFWSMIYQLKSRTVVLLQDIDFLDSKCSRFWPTEGVQNFDQFLVECQCLTFEGDIEITLVHVTFKPAMDKGEEPLVVRIVHMRNWPVSCNLPSDTPTVISTIQKIQAWQLESNHPTTVVCLDGVTACGLFCAALHICDRINSDNEIDVFQTVKCIRVNRPHFIVNEVQYDFLHDFLIAYLATLQV